MYQGNLDSRRDYTREAGCRNLEREIGSVLRNVAVRIAEGKATAVRVEASDVAEILGAPRFENEVAMRVSLPGVATGLAWTPVGGDILFIEATRVPAAAIPKDGPSAGVALYTALVWLLTNRTVLLPGRNRKDLEDIPESVKREVEFVWLERVEEATAIPVMPEFAPPFPMQ